jgi:hypothetical protein
VADTSTTDDSAQILYPHKKKDESRDTDVGTENIRPKAVCDRRSDSQRIVAGRTATRANKPATTPYLAINWQRGCINTRFTSRDPRFPTPRQRRNTRQKGALVTTNHLLFPHSPGAAGALLPISQPISNFLRGKSPARTERGAGGQPDGQP